MRNPPPEFSILVIAHNMRREIPRTLTSLAPPYQSGLAGGDYEVLVIENGSQEPLDERMVTARGPEFHYFYLAESSPSPARAINFGAAHARGDILVIMIDGACLLSPGVFRLARVALHAFPQPLVMTRYFYLGPGPQHETLQQGYSPAVEDELLHSIHWPAQGYRLFEIGTPLRATPGRGVWFAKLFESCCLFIPRTLFRAIGGCDERFDLPGGGFLAPDLYRRAATYPGTTVIQLLGEAVFHQVHGGTTTNTSPADRQVKLEQFQRQYRDLRGEDFTVAPGRAYSFGHLPREAQRKY